MNPKTYKITIYKSELYKLPEKFRGIPTTHEISHGFTFETTFI